VFRLIQVSGRSLRPAILTQDFLVFLYLQANADMVPKDSKC